MAVEPATRRSLGSRVSVWIWGVMHIHVVLRRAIAGVYAAEDAKARVGMVEDRVRTLVSQEEHRSAVQETAIAVQETAIAVQETAIAVQETAIAVQEVEDRVRTLVSQEEHRSAVQETAIAVQETAIAVQETAIENLRGRADTLTTMMTTMSKRLAVETQALSDLSTQTQALRGEILFQQRRLTRLAIPAAAKSIDEPATGILDQRFDSLYAALEDVFRGSREDIKRRLLSYADRLVLAGAGQQDKPIIDIGCGRGEWLELLKEKGLHAYGVDINTVMVERSVSLGLDARHADAMAHLGGIEDAGRSALTAFHVVEHLPFAALVDLLDEAFRVLVPGGMLILETPNPETMKVGATSFYNDPTHRNPLMPDPLQFIVRHRGFAEVEILRLHPFTQGLLQEKTADAALLNRVLFGPQDYAIVARRP